MPVSQWAEMMNPEKSSLLQVAPRLMQIMRVLVRHKFLGVLRGRTHWPSPKNVREAIQELGLTFLKFGQVLAMRPDLLPVNYIKELEVLHDHLPPMSFDMVRATVEGKLGAPLAQLFSSFNETPIAAATIAQVHEAAMPDGRRVAVKVQRPGLQEIISRDIAAMTYMVALGERLLPQIRPLDLPVVVGEFAHNLKRETDFSREARSITLFRTALADVPDLWIPDVVAERSKRTVLTQEYSAGIRIDDYAKLHADAMPRAINTLVTLMLQTIFEEGLFHADPHPGNVFVMPDGRLSLLDFGMTGELDEAMRESLIRLLEAVVQGDARAATEAYLEMAPASEEVNHASLLLDIKAALYEINRSDLAHVSIGAAFDSLMRAGSRNGVHNPGEFFLLTRAFVILESLISQLAPQHGYMESFREEVSRLTTKHFAPARVKEKTIDLARELERLMTDAPGDARRVLRRVAEGDLGRVQSPALEALGNRVTGNLDRLAGAVMCAALMVGGPILLAAMMSGWHRILGQVMVVLGVFGMVIIVIGGLLGARGRR